MLATKSRDVELGLSNFMLGGCVTQRSKAPLFVGCTIRDYGRLTTDGGLKIGMLSPMPGCKGVLKSHGHHWIRVEMLNVL